MSLLSPRLLVPLTLVVVGWAGVHQLTSHPITVIPGAWPGASAPPAAPPAVALPSATPPPSSAPVPGAIPILPGALQQLNGSTRDTAIGLYAVVQQLEQALRSHLEQLAHQLEPGR